ncbi:MAG TPA: DUF1593 domain-containing protein [Spirochaetota bacterium]|nr:DUF1593 domain-containing protein [Spirochaetota bacterium]
MKKLILLFMIMISISFISCEDAKESDDKTVQQNEGKENGTESGVDNDANPDNDDSGENGTNSNNNPAEDPIENPTENPVEIVIENPSLLKKPRIVVMADIMPLPPEGEEPKHEVDDVQSFIRLLVYSNEFEIIGLIGANSRYGVNRGDSEAFYGLIDLYEQIKPNLDKHAKGFPTAENLRKVVFEGQRTYLGWLVSVKIKIQLVQTIFCLYLKIRIMNRYGFLDGGA